MEETTGNLDGSPHGAKQGMLATVKIVLKNTACCLQPQQQGWNIYSKSSLAATGRAARQSQPSYMVAAWLGSLLSSQTLSCWAGRKSGAAWSYNQCKVSFSWCLLSKNTQLRAGRGCVCLLDCLIPVLNWQTLKWVSSVRALTTAENRSSLPYDAAEHAWRSSLMLCARPAVRGCLQLEGLGKALLVRPLSPSQFWVAHAATLQKEKLPSGIRLAWCVLCYLWFLARGERCLPCLSEAQMLLS